MKDYIKENRFRLTTFQINICQSILLITSMLFMEAKAATKGKESDVVNNTARTRLKFGLNKGALFSDNSQEKVSNWSSSYHKEYMKEMGIRDAAVHYNINLRSSRKNPLSWIYQNYIDQGIDATVTLLIKINKEDPDHIKEIAKSEGLHYLILNGYYDQQLINIGKKINSKRKKIRLSLLHEGNGGWYEWGMCAKGNTQNSLIKSLRHSIDLINSTGASQYIDYDFNLNRTGCDGQMTRASQYLPQIEKIVDRISVSTYNRCGTAARYKEEKQFSTEFLPAYSIITRYTKKPIYIAETATSGLCGDKIMWYKSLLESLDKFPQLTGINFFFGDVPVGIASNDVPIMWGLNTAQQKKKFKSMITKYTANQKRENESFKKNNTLLGFNSLPWSVWMEVANEIMGPYSEGINSTTQQEFGKRGFTILTNANQRFYWGKKGTFQHGPGVSLLGAFSSNKNRWWSNQIFPQLTYSMQFSALTKHLGQWDASRLELYIGYRKYYVPFPKGYQGFESGIRALFIFGGDHM